MVSNEEVEVVISGIGGCFPKSKNIEEFANILLNQEKIVDTARWESDITDKPDFIGKVNEINYFDASFFGIHRQQTVFMDPLCRMALECTFEALVDAGINPTSVRGKKIAVVVSSTLSENDSLMFENVENGFGVTGQARTMLANRISYWMNVTGPSYSADNSWLGGLQAIKNGYEAIKYGQCEGVIVGAVNLAMNMFPHYLYKTLGIISPDEHTRVFDENANGYVRSEGIIIMYLQRADTARRNYANILDVDMMYNGNRFGAYCKMNVDSARNFLTNFYQRSGVDPSQVEYMETYGCGIKTIDEFELNVLDSVFNPTKTNPLLVGSVKANVGHSEAASIFMSIVKTIIAMEKCEIPGNCSFETPNSNIPALIDGRIKVVTENTRWPGTLAAVNGLGLVTCYGHILLKSKSRITNTTTETKLPHLYIVSTRTEAGMREIIDKLKSQTTLNDEFMKVINDIFYNHIPSHLYRGYLVSSKSEEKETFNMIEEISHYSGSHRPIWFVYSGMGSQWISMGKDLLRLPIFAAAIAKCHKTLLPHGINLTEIITSSENQDMFNNILNSFVGIAAIQIGLTDVLNELGVKPDFMLGHSVGELGCAYADGCLTAEQMILAAYYRGRASLEVELEPGLMAAVGMGATKMQELLPSKVDIACRNGPDSCTISGPADAMRSLVSTLQASGIFARLVDVAGIAYHSRYIKPAAPLLLNYLKKLIPSPKMRSSRWLSSSVPEANGGWESELAKYASAEYLTNNLLSCVYLEEALTHIPNEAIVIEIAPHGLLQAILKRSLHTSCVNIALTKRGEEKGVEFLMANLGKLYLAGVSLPISNLYKDDVSKEYKPECCSKNTPSLAPLVRWNHTETWRTGVDEFKDNSQSECTYMFDINSEMFHDLNGHRIYKTGDDVIGVGTITVPVTTYLPLICGILSNIRRLANIVFEEVHLIRHRVIPEALNIYIPPFRIMAQRGTGIFEVSDRYGLLVSGRYSIPHEQESQVAIPDVSQHNIGRKLDELTKDELYREFSQRGHNYQDTFKAINKLDVYESGMIANIEWKTGWHMFAAAMLQMSIYREGQFRQVPSDVFFLRSLSYSFTSSYIPKEGTNIDVVYNYTTNKIISPILCIEAPCCRSYNIESNIIVAHKCYSVENEADVPQVGDNKTAVVTVEEDTIKIEDFNSDLEWAIKLNTLLCNDNLDKIYLICRVIPNKGIDIFSAFMRNLPNGHLIRLIIILDKTAPASATHAFYQPIFRQTNYCVALYSAGVWEFRSTTSSRIDTEHNVRDHFKSVISAQHIRRKIPGTNIKYVGINTASVVPNIFQTKHTSAQHQFGVVDYCGIDTKSSSSVMGVAAINAENYLTADPILKWSIPKQWTFMEGATVPFAYTTAFYILSELVDAKPGETILIHNGCSSIGQALIRIAHSLGCFIYTTVGSEKQRIELINNLRMVRSGSIFEYTSQSFEMKLMNATQGEGIDILINCLPSEYLKCGLRCVSPLSRVIHLIDDYQKENFHNEKIGLGTFLRVTGMYGLKISKILELPVDVKMRLRDQVSNALENEQLIIPIRRNILHKREALRMKDVASYLLGSKVTGGVVIPIEETKNTVLNKNESSFIIYGEENLENIITLTHWLATIHGAKNIVILMPQTHDTNNKKFLQRNLSIIKTNTPGICIENIEIPVNKPEVVVQQILKLNLSNIAGVLFFSDGNNQNDKTFIKKLQDTIPTHIVLLNCVSNTQHINLERYHTKNIQNVSFVRWDKKRRFTDILNCLTTALEETVDIFIRRDTIEEEDSIITSFSFEDYCNVLSTSIPSFLNWSPPISDITVTQIASSCPKIMSESAPVFVIPGLLGIQCSYLQNFVRNILSPVYVLDGDYSITLDQLSIRLGERIRKIFPNGPFNIIGVSTGGALAIELAKHLEIDHEEKVQLYLLDGAPDTMKNMISEQNKHKNSYEIVLLRRLLNIDDSQILKALVNAPPNWNARVNVVLRDSVKKDKQTQLLFTLKQRFDAALNHTSDNRMLNGITRFLKPLEAAKENTKLVNFCKQIKVEVIKGNHFTILQADKLTNCINNNILMPKIYD